MQILEPLVVTRVKPIFPEHLQLALSNLLGLLKLHRVELNRRVLRIVQLAGVVIDLLGGLIQSVLLVIT